MKALIIEKPERQWIAESAFQDSGVETSSEYDPSEKYDFAFIHHNGDFGLADRIRREQPKCILLGYSSIIERQIAHYLSGRVLEDKMNEHYDELVYWDCVPEKIAEVVARKGGHTE